MAWIGRLDSGGLPNKLGPRRWWCPHRGGRCQTWGEIEEEDGTDPLRMFRERLRWVRHRRPPRMVGMSPEREFPTRESTERPAMRPREKGMMPEMAAEWRSRTAREGGKEDGAGGLGAVAGGHDVRDDGEGLASADGDMLLEDLELDIVDEDRITVVDGLELVEAVVELGDVGEEVALVDLLNHDHVGVLVEDRGVVLLGVSRKLGGGDQGGENGREKANDGDFLILPLFFIFSRVWIGWEALSGLIGDLDQSGKRLGWGEEDEVAGLDGEEERKGGRGGDRAGEGVSGS